MKKLLLILLAIIFAVNIKTNAEDFYSVYNGDTIYYNITSSVSPRTVEVTFRGISNEAYANEYSGAVSIPDSVIYSGNYYEVNSIGANAFWYCTELTSLTIPNSVNSIGNNSFHYCTGLTSIPIPNSVNFIADYAFADCMGLTSITIPSSITSINEGVFFGCSGLTSVTIPNSVNSIGVVAFIGCNALTSVTIPNSVTSIGDWAFKNCSALTSLIIPSSVTSIGNSAFMNCSSLTSVLIPNSLTLLSDNIFCNCIGLTSITIPNSITSIGDYVFSNCTGLTSVTIPNSVITIGDNAFSDCSGLNSITIPNSVTSIGSWTFSNCTGLTSIIIPNSVTSIGGWTFQYCGLTSITLSDNITSIPNGIFYGCSGLTSITIPNSVTSIGNYSFENCSGLTSITIPYFVNSIGDNILSGCNSLASIKSHAITPPSINQFTFANVNKSIPLYVPCSSISSYQSSYYWNEFTNKVTFVGVQYLDTSICHGNYYTNYGANIDSAGVYTLYNGCDSVILTLSINPIYNDTIYAEICQGETYTQFDFNENTSGFYTKNLQTINGCDSIVNLSLIVSPLPNIPQNLSIYNIATNNIEIGWQGDAESYNIYRDDSLIANVIVTNYWDNFCMFDGETYCYKVKAKNSNGCESAFSDSICYTYLGIENIEQTNISTKLYPNPTEGKSRLEIEGLNSEADVFVYDMIGRVIKKHQISIGENELDIDLSGYAKGIYSIRIVNESINQTKKLIVQ